MLPRLSLRSGPHTGLLIGVGLASSLALAAAGYLAGALPSGDPGAGFRTGGPGAVSAPFLIGLVCWLAGLGALSYAWWRLLALGPPSTAAAVGSALDNVVDSSVAGRPAARAAAEDAASRPMSPRQMLGIGALWAAPLLVAPALGSRDVYAYACQGWLWSNGLDPYAMGVADGGCPWSEAVPQLWWSTPTPYGPLALLLSGLAAAIGQQVGGLVAAVGVLRLLAVAAAALLAVALPRLAVACGVSPSAALGLGLVTPLVLVHGVSAAHNDLTVAALLVAALAVATARWPAAVACAGVLLAGAVAVKVTAVIAAPFLLILAGRRWPAAAGAMVVAFGGLTLLAWVDLGWLDGLRDTGSLVQWSSAPTAIGMAAGYLLRAVGLNGWVDPAVTVARALGLLVLAYIGVRALLSAWRGRGEPGRVVLSCGIVLAAAALLGPVFYPWYALAPLAVLAASVSVVRYRRILAVATVVVTLLVLPNGLGVPVLTKAVGAFAVTIAVIVLAVRTRPRARA